jgi:predicted Rossmann-fold nucleotide-binding protein
MKYKIGIFGSAEGNTDEIIEKARELGRILGKNSDIILLTGASNGLPYAVAEQAYKIGQIEIWDFPPTLDQAGLTTDTPDADLSIYKKIVYVPNTYEFSADKQISRKYRNITTTATCDAGIIVSGRWGTLNEVTNLYDFGKIIGVLTGTGGIADELEALSKKISKPSRAKFVFEQNPEILTNRILKLLSK